MQKELPNLSLPNEVKVTVHSVHSNLVKIHSKSPFAIFMAKHLAGYYL